MVSTAAAELCHGPGYVIGPQVDAGEVSWVRAFVERKWRGVLTAKYPFLADKIAATSITDYHKLSHLIDHSSTWSKDSRLFTASEVDQLLGKLSVFGYLRDAFGPFQVADVEHLGHPEVYWRLVRPNHPDDVAGAHADAWFYTLTNDMPLDEQKRIVKVWFPVFSEPGVSGLSVAQATQKMDLKYSGEMRHGRMKPIMTDARAADIPLSALSLSAGQCVAFHIDLLHGGLSHKTDQTRVSIEFAIRLNAPLN